MPSDNETDEMNGVDDQRSVETGTPSGRAYTKKRWTLGNSADLVEGQTPEPLLLTISWIVVPALMGLLFIALMTM